MSINYSHVFFNFVPVSKRQFNVIFVLFIMMIASFSVSASPIQQTKIKQIAQLAEYIGVDYVAAVGNGEILDSDEYQEMTEFSHVIIEQADQLSSQTNEFDTVKVQAKA
ncbi:MAG: iron permease, partial [Pseudoalteromonas sp.]